MLVWKIWKCQVILTAVREISGKCGKIFQGKLLIVKFTFVATALFDGIVVA